MQANFDIRQYKMISMSCLEGADREAVTKQLLTEIQDIPKAVSAECKISSTYFIIQYNK